VRRLRVQLTVLLALLGLLVVAWGATIFLGAHDAARTNASLLSTVDRFDDLRRRSAELGRSFVTIGSCRRVYLLTGGRETYQAQLGAERRAKQLFGELRKLAGVWPELAPVVEQLAGDYRSWLRAGRTERGPGTRAARPPLPGSPPAASPSGASSACTPGRRPWTSGWRPSRPPRAAARAAASAPPRRSPSGPPRWCSPRWR
jgi:hypothetical protein